MTVTSRVTSNNPGAVLSFTWTVKKNGSTYVTGSDSSIAALRLAAELGGKLGIDVHALGVWNHPTLLYGNYYYPESDITPEEDARRVVEATLRAAFDDAVPPFVSAGTQKGRPA